MKAVILAGGLGTRISEETDTKPRPMVEIGGMPILWHIMKIYSSHGINDFVICCGYKGQVIKEYFKNYFVYNSDFTVSTQNSNIQVVKKNHELWNITLVDTGNTTKTGGRLKQVGQYIKDEENFCFTYGDGVADLNISKLVNFHKEHGCQATLTATRPVGRYGVLKLGSENRVKQFQEKPEGESSWINGGFFVLNRVVLDRISGDTTSWEEEPLSGLAEENQLVAFKHHGFWHPMDTLRDKNYLEKLWLTGDAPWKTW